MACALGDRFGDQCRGLVKRPTRRRCTKRVRFLVQASTRKSVIAAIATGWPMCLPGMRQPTFRAIGLCYWHWRLWERDTRLGGSGVRLANGRRYGTPGRETPALKRARASAQARLTEWQRREDTHV